MKKLAAVLLAVLVLVAGATVAFASVRGTYKGLPVVGVVVNGRELQPDVPAVVMEGRTLLPVRAVAEALGAKVEWDQSTFTARVSLPRELDGEELGQWRQELIGKLAALWAQYEVILADLEEGRIDRTACQARLLELGPQAEEVLRYSVSVTSSDPEIWGKIVGSSVVAALAYADIVLQVGAAGDPALHESAQLAHQAAAKLFGLQEAPSETVDRALFSEYFADLSLGKLPPEYVGNQDWPHHVVATSVFSRGDTMVTMGEVRREVQLVTGCYDVKAGRYVQEPAPAGPVLKPGGFAGTSQVDLPAGDYEVRCFVGQTLVAILPFAVR